MAMPIRIKWYGDKILKDVHKQNRRLIQCVAHTIERSAKQICPVRTGTLERSIRSVVTPDKAQVVAGGAQGCAPGVASPVEYAGYVELGTSRMSARPYMRPAIEAFSKADLQKCIKKVKGV